MNAIVENNPCPACKAQPGEECRTPIDGQVTNWTHDARVVADLIRDIRDARAMRKDFES